MSLLAFVPACGPSGGDGNPPPCTPGCDGRTCGDDGCGGSCGDCGDGWTCDVESGTCVTCQPACDGRTCGDDGCGGSCGDCGDGWTCNPYIGKCVGGCTPDCTGRSCGTDGCSGSCGDCDAAKDCSAAGQCVAKASCTDGQKNGTEGDKDCGGTCPDRCVVGQGCNAPGDCASGFCQGGACAADPTCDNGQKDPGETDTDCGGTKCPQCPVSKFCKEHKDCLSLACIYGVCKEPTCDDGAKNQGEPDIDCGGPCAPCGLGRTCFVPADCEAGGCDGGTCCQPNACGVCSDTPVEICDGKDNDCNGQTDEGLGLGDLCPKQDGVCQGSRQQCRNGAWTCDASVYQSWSNAYQTTESTCDGQDNDCNGQTDEPAKCCVPKCEGKGCGDDGCGGDCGPCDGDRYCLADQCLAKGAELWSYQVDGYTITTTPVVGPDGTLYVTTDFPFQLVAVGSNGKKKWSVDAPDQGSYSDLHIGKGGVVIARATPAGIEAFSPAGKSQWTSPVMPDAMAVAKDGTVIGAEYVAGSWSLQAVGTGGGAALWTTALVADTGWFYATPVIATDGTIYVGGPDNNLYAVTAAGKVKWSKPVGSLRDSGLAIGADGTVYVGTGKPGDGGGQSLFAFKPDGTQKWSYAGGGDCASYPLVGADGTVYFVTHTDLVALTPAGKLKWQTTLEDTIWNAPAVTAHGVVMVTDNTDLHAFGPDGKQVWVAAQRVDSPLVLTRGGVLLFNVNTGSGSDLWALDVTSPAGSPWPMAAHDGTGSGQYTDATANAPW